MTYGRFSMPTALASSSRKPSMEKHLETGYQDDEGKRAELNRLMLATFHFTFEPWYQSGLWDSRYTTFSYFVDGKIAANIGVYEMNLDINGEKATAIQIGAVTSAPEYRGQHLVSALFDIVFQKYEKADFAFLFSAPTAKDFYPQFGFTIAHGYFSQHQVTHNDKYHFRKADFEKDFAFLSEIVKNGRTASAIRLENSYSLMMFSLPFCKDDLFIDEEHKILAIKKVADGKMIINEIIGFGPLSILEVAGSLAESENSVCVFAFPVAETGGIPIEAPDILYIRGRPGLALANFLVPQLIRT